MCCFFFSLLLWESVQTFNAPSNKGEYQQNSIAGHFGTFLGGATHTFGCVAHSTHARFLQAVPRCKGD